MDPAVAPSTGTVVPGGLNFRCATVVTNSMQCMLHVCVCHVGRESHYVAEALAHTGLLGSMDMVEVRRTLLFALAGGLLVLLTGVPPR